MPPLSPSVHVCSWVSELPLHRPPSDNKFFSSPYETKTLSWLPPGPVWSHFEFTDLTSKTCNEWRYQIQNYAVLLSWGVKHFKGPGNQLWNPWDSLLPSCKHYNFLTWFPKVWEASNPDGILFYQSTVQDRQYNCLQRTNGSIQTGWSRVPVPTAAGIETHWWWSGSVVRVWLVEVLRGALWHSIIHRHSPHTH